MAAYKESIFGFSIPLLLVEVFLLVSVVVSFSSQITMHDQQRIGQMLLLLLMALGGMSLWQRSALDAFQLLPCWTQTTWTLGLGLGVISALLAAHPRYAGLEWALLVLLSWTVFVLANEARKLTDNFDTWAVRIIILVALFIALRALINYGLVLFSSYSIDAGKLFSSSFGNPRFFGQAASLLLPLMVLPLLLGNLPTVQRVLLFLLLAIFWMLLIVSATRGSFLGMAVAASILALTSWHTACRWLGWQAGGLLLGLILFSLLFLWLPESAQHPGLYVENRLENPTTLSKREIIWSLAWQQILAHPWLGIGPMHLAAIPNPVATHPHNAPLQLAAEWGLPATVAFLLPLVYGMRSLLIRVRQAQTAPDQTLLICLSASLLAATTQSIVDGVIVMPYTQTLLIFILGWAIGVYFRSAKPATKPISRARSAFSSTLLILALGLLLWGIYPEVLHRAEITRNLLDSGVTHFNPRFWVHGWIP